MAPREVITDPEELKKGGLALKKAWQAGAITEVECRVLFEKYDGACVPLSVYFANIDHSGPASPVKLGSSLVQVWTSSGSRLSSPAA